MEVYSTELLKLSDLGSGLMTYSFDSIFNGKATARKSSVSVIISVLARIISESFPNLTGGPKLDKSTKNQLVVFALNSLYASMLGRDVLKASLLGVSSDLLSEYVFEVLSMEDSVLIGGNQTNKKRSTPVGSGPTAGTFQQQGPPVGSNQRSEQTL